MEGMALDYRVSIVGLLIGLLIGLTGTGGGALLAPIMISFFRLPPAWAVSTDIAYSMVTKAVGSIIHFRQKHVNIRIALWLACGSVPAIFLSAGLVQHLRNNNGDLLNEIILRTLGFTLLGVAVLLVFKPYLLKYPARRNFGIQRHFSRELDGADIISRSSERRKRDHRPALMILIGAIVGFLSGLTSVGSGTLIIVALAFLFPRLGPKELVGTDIFQSFLLLISGSISYSTAGTMNWTMVALLLLGSLPGVSAGSLLSKYLPDPFMRPLLATVLALSGLKLI